MGISRRRVLLGVGAGKGAEYLVREGDVLERWLTRAYERFGAQILPAFLIVGMAVSVLGAIPVAGWSVGYLRFSLSDFLLLVVWGMVVVSGVGTVFFWRLRDVFGPVLTWSGENRTLEHAGSVWRAAVRLPSAVAVRVGYAAAVAVPLFVVPFVVVSVTPASSGLMLGVCGAVVTAEAVIVMVFSAELALRPLLKDVAAVALREPDPVLRGWRLRTRVLAPVPFVTLYCALTVGGFVGLVAPGAARFVLAVGIAVATIGIGGAIFWVVTRVLLDPIDDLIMATRRVSDGDIMTPVPVVTADELGELARAFNRMLASLRRHQREGAAAEAEIRRLERDIHDGAQQRLAAIAMWLDALENRLATGEANEATAIARRASTDLRLAIEDLRRLARGMPPPVLTRDGLDKALSELVDRTPGATVRGSAGSSVAPAVGVAVYFSVAEALTNALRHSGAGTIEVTVQRSDKLLRIEIRDDGCGGADFARGSGLLGLVGRLSPLGGSLTLDSPACGGTVLGVEVPADPALDTL